MPPFVEKKVCGEIQSRKLNEVEKMQLVHITCKIKQIIKEYADFVLCKTHFLTKSRCAKKK